MKTIIRRSVLFLLAAALSLPVRAQQIEPSTIAPQKAAIGLSSPDFRLEVQLGGKGKPVPKSLADFRGRWLLLEFWSKTCAVCIQGFPRLQAIGDSLAGKMDIILIGKNDTRYNDGIQAMYQRIAGQEQLRLNVAFDTVSLPAFGVWATPHAVIISPQGIVKSISYGTELTLDAIKQLMEGGPNQIAQLADGRPASYSTSWGTRRILSDTVSALAHSSEISPSLYVDNATIISMADNYRKGVLLTKKSTLPALYLLAYFGRYYWNGADDSYGTIWPKPLFEMADTSAFIADIDRGTGLYHYRLEMADRQTRPEQAMQAIQSDLDGWFGYQAEVREQLMPIWKLVCTSSQTAQKLASRSDSTSIIGDHSGLVMKKARTLNIMNIFRSYYQKNITLDATGITGYIDITIDATLTDLSSLKRALAGNGLAIVPGSKLMKVLVISEKK